MLHIEEIVRLLETKKALFLEFEEVTDQMARDPLEKAEAHMAQRSRLQEEIDQADAQLELLYREVPSAKTAASNQQPRGSFSPDLRRVYDAALEVKGVILRLLDNAPLFEDRLRMEQERLKNKIETLEQTGGAAAQRYYQGVSTGLAHSYMPPARKKVQI